MTNFTFFKDNMRSVSSRCSSANSSNCFNRKSTPSSTQMQNVKSANGTSVMSGIQTAVQHILKTPAKKDSSLGKYEIYIAYNFVLFEMKLS